VHVIINKNDEKERLVKLAYIDFERATGDAEIHPRGANGQLLIFF